MSAISTIRLLEIEPDIARFLTAEERAEAQRLTVPLHTVPRSSLDLESVLEQANAFGALVVDGMLLHRLRIGDHTALRLLGPGDIVSRIGTRSMMLTESGCRAAARTRLAMLANEFLLAAHRWPRIVSGLQLLIAGQSERLATQLVICQLPRVEDRLLALLWLLAESWGQVTPAGTTLPISLTHDALGELIGARRPTVTLALGALSERGSIVRHDQGWMLLEPVAQPSGVVTKIEEPRLIEALPSAWKAPAPDARIDEASRDALKETVGVLRRQHRLDVDRHQERLERIKSMRERSLGARGQSAGETVSRRPAPS